MRRYILTPILTLNILFLAFHSIKAQEDSLSVYKQNIQQYDEVRDAKQELFTSPSRRAHYSEYSFSELMLTYQSENKTIYRAPLGSGDVGLTLQAQSYKKLPKNQSVWGKAGYKNIQVKNLKWNENLDYHRVAPYVVADSVGGNLKTEHYYFGGGYAKKYDKWALGLALDYTASMGYRSRDPRVNNTSSDLVVGIGADYSLYRDLSLGTYFKINKYTQNADLDFVSEIGHPKVYQMTGFGQFQYFLTGKNSTFEELRYTIGASIANKNGKDWYVATHYSNGDNKKYVRTASGNTPYDANILSNRELILEGAKFFSLENQMFGLVLNYQNNKIEGTEIGYDGNSSDIKRVYERASYFKDVETIALKGIYQYQKEKSMWWIQPLFSLQKHTEKRIYPVSIQKFQSYRLGAILGYKTEINLKQSLSFSAQVHSQKFNNAELLLTAGTNFVLNQWINEDFLYLSSSNLRLGFSARYDWKINKLPAMFCKFNWQNQRIQNKNNTFASLNVGITF